MREYLSMNYEHCIRCTICVENCPYSGQIRNFPDRNRRDRTLSVSGQKEKKHKTGGFFCAVSANAVKWPALQSGTGANHSPEQQRYGKEHSQTPAHLFLPITII